VLQAACIVGTEIKDWQKLDFAGVKGRSLFEDKEIGAGPGTNVMGGALISLAWLANKLLANGKHLQAGDVILTGSVHPPVFLPGPGVAKTEFVGLGGSAITIQ
jgi:2-oxo-3-hexenedioate decarboxylase/2-keto-4-pentenoate hydratase